MLNEANSIWRKKITVLRNDVYAHLSDTDVLAKYSDAALSPNEIERLIDLSKQLVNKLSYANDRGAFAFNLDSACDTYNVLEDCPKEEIDGCSRVSHAPKVKLSHFATLALIGWYLMMPPTSYESGEPRVLTDAPLSTWKVLGTYDSAPQCQRARMREERKLEPFDSFIPAGRVVITRHSSKVG